MNQGNYNNVDFNPYQPAEMRNLGYQQQNQRGQDLTPNQMMDQIYPDDISSEELHQTAAGNIYKKSRIGFIRKVYLILAFQLGITCISIAVTILNNDLRKLIQQGLVLWILSFVGSLVTLLILICVPGMSTKVPSNYILLFAFTIFESYLISFLTSFYTVSTVFTAAVLTAAIVLGLTAYAFYTDTDFTFMGGFLFMGIFVLMGLSFIQFFVNVKWLNMLICVFGVLLFGAYLIYDTQLLIGTKGLKYEIDEYILAALNIYLDIINIFVYLLEILGSND